MIRDMEYEQVRAVWAFVRWRRLNRRAWCRRGIVRCSGRISSHGRRACIPTRLLVTTGTRLTVRLLVLSLPWHWRSPVRALAWGVAPGALCTACSARGSRQLPSRILRIRGLSRILLPHCRRVQHIIISTSRFGTLSGICAIVLILILYRIRLGSHLILLRSTQVDKEVSRSQEHCEIELRNRRSLIERHKHIPEACRRIQEVLSDTTYVPAHLVAPAPPGLVEPYCG